MSYVINLKNKDNWSNFSKLSLPADTYLFNIQSNETITNWINTTYDKNRAMQFCSASDAREFAIKSGLSISSFCIVECKCKMILLL